MSFLKLILYPFAGLYTLVTSIRNYLFDTDYKKSFEFETNVIGVGNLTVGGTGKSPMVEYIIDLLNPKYSIATLSRGYGRKTRGFKIASKKDTAETLGDEPFQFYRKYPDVVVSVGEERAVAIPHLLAEKSPDVIIMDDSYQHRYVKPSLNILLTDYNRPFYDDFVLPVGRLRESKSGANRADIVVVTKCPENLTNVAIENIENNIKKYTDAPVCFSYINYLSPRPFTESVNKEISNQVILFSGLANNKPFTEYVSEHYGLVDDFYFADHHHYTSKDLNSIEERFRRSGIENLSIITTEKDMVKLLNDDLRGIVEHWPLFYLPIRHQFIKGGSVFDDMVFQSIKNYSNPAI